MKGGGISVLIREKVRTLERNAMRSTIAHRAVIMPVWTVTTRITVNINYEMISIPSPVLTSNDLVHNIVRLAEPSPMFTLYIVTRVQCSMFFQQQNTRAHTDECRSVVRLRTKCQTRAQVMTESATAENASQMMTMTLNCWKWTNS